MMDIKILVLFSDEKNFLKSKRRIEDILFSRIKEGGAINLIVYSDFIENIEEINPEILKDIDGILYTSDVQREDVEELTSILKEKTNGETMFARISVNLGGLSIIDFVARGIATLVNVDIYPYMIRYSNMEVESFLD